MFPFRGSSFELFDDDDWLPFLNIGQGESLSAGYSSIANLLGYLTVTQTVVAPDAYAATIMAADAKSVTVKA